MEEYKKYSLHRLMMTLPLLLKKVFRGEEPPALMEYGLNKTHLKTLFLINHLETPNMTAICDHVNIAKGSLTPVVDTLIQMGLVDRLRDPQDRRQLNLSLTPEGNKVKNIFEEWVNKQIDKKLTTITDSEKKDFHEALIRLYEIALKL